MKISNKWALLAILAVGSQAVNAMSAAEEEEGNIKNVYEQQKGRLTAPRERPISYRVVESQLDADQRARARVMSETTIPALIDRINGFIADTQQALGATFDRKENIESLIKFLDNVRIAISEAIGHAKLKEADIDRVLKGLDNAKRIYQDWANKNKAALSASYQRTNLEQALDRLDYLRLDLSSRAQ